MVPRADRAGPPWSRSSRSISAVPKYAYRATHCWLSSHAMALFKNFAFSSSLPCGWNCVGGSRSAGPAADFAHRRLQTTYLSDPHGAIAGNTAHVRDECLEVVQKRARVVLQHSGSLMKVLRKDLPKAEGRTTQSVHDKSHSLRAQKATNSGEVSTQQNYMPGQVKRVMGSCLPNESGRNQWYSHCIEQGTGSSSRAHRLKPQGLLAGPFQQRAAYICGMHPPRQWY